METCNKCGIELNQDNWRPSNKRQHRKICKKCVRQIQSKHRQTDKYRQTEREYSKKHRETIHQNMKRFRDRLTLKVLSIIGKGEIKCVRCGNTDVRILTINHKNGGGRKERRTYDKGKGGRPGLFRDILKGNRTTNDLEILCRPCNDIHYLELKYPDLIGKMKVVIQ